MNPKEELKLMRLEERKMKQTEIEKKKLLKLEDKKLKQDEAKRRKEELKLMRIEDKKQKKRTPSECNGCEYVVALLFDDPSIHNFDSLMTKIKSTNQSKILFNNESDKNEYIKDILKKKKIMNDYIYNFTLQTDKFNFDFEYIQYIYLSGKICKFEIINNLNKNLDVKQCKADVYIEFKNKEFVGISVKQSVDAQLSNYSTHVILNEIIPGSKTELTSNKKTFMTSNNFTTFQKHLRKDMNTLFYPKNYDNNIYFQTLNNYIQKYNIIIGQMLYDYIYCTSTPYDVYEFNGQTISHLNYANNDTNSNKLDFYEHSPYKYDKKGILRNAAKLFYKLEHKNKSFRVEVRFKGNILTTAPQFCIYSENDNMNNNMRKNI